MLIERAKEVSWIECSMA